MKIVFEPIFEQQQGYQRIYVDLPGMGDSSAELSFASSDRILSALTEFTDKVIGREFLLMGYSYGGYLARALAAKRSGSVKGLFLLAPMVLPDRAARTLPPEDWYKKLAAKAEKAYRAALGTTYKSADAAFLKALDQKYALSFALDEMSFDKPALILLGRQDTVVGYADQLRLLTAYPRASIALLDMGSHMLQVEQAELLSALTKNWLERCAFSPET
jgi:pimeloyl-ACP methyl ester carboxylesterase